MRKGDEFFGFNVGFFFFFSFGGFWVFGFLGFWVFLGFFLFGFFVLFLGVGKVASETAVYSSGRSYNCSS